MEKENLRLNQDLERRTFLKVLIMALNALITVALAVPGLGYILTPLFRKDEQTWVKVGRVEDSPQGSFTKAVFRYISASGYVREEKSAFVWMRQEEDGQLTAFSPKCTHMGCNVSWSGRNDRFECPCHGGMYDERGNVIDGPPPRPLQRFETKVENDSIFVKRTEDG